MKDLSFSPKSGVPLLQQFVESETLWEIVRRLKSEDKRARTIILPSAHELRKSIAFFFGERVERKEITWEQVAKIWRGDLKMKDTLSIKEMKRLHQQRKKEIFEENK